MKTESSFCLYHIYVQFINYFQLLKKYILIGLAIFIKFSANHKLVKDTHILSYSVKLTSQPECTFGFGECYIGICWSLRFKIIYNLIQILNQNILKQASKQENTIKFLLIL